jgi:hypothetical protein
MLSPAGEMNSLMREAHSTMAPAATQTPRAMPNGASHGPRQWIAKVATNATTVTATAARRRCSPPSRSPRFQASMGPSGTASSSTAISGPKVELK